MAGPSWAEVEPLLKNTAISAGTRRNLALMYATSKDGQLGNGLGPRSELAPYLTQLGIDWDEVRRTAIFGNRDDIASSALDTARREQTRIEQEKAQAPPSTGQPYLYIDGSGLPAHMQTLVKQVESALNSMLSLVGSGRPVTSSGGAPRAGTAPGDAGEGTAAVTYEQLNDEQRKDLTQLGVDAQEVRRIVAKSATNSMAAHKAILGLFDQVRADIAAAKPNISNTDQQTALSSVLKRRVADAEDVIRNAVEAANGLQAPGGDDQKAGDQKAGDQKAGDQKAGDQKAGGWSDGGADGGGQDYPSDDASPESVENPGGDDPGDYLDDSDYSSGDDPSGDRGSPGSPSALDSALSALQSVLGSSGGNQGASSPITSTPAATSPVGATSTPQSGSANRSGSGSSGLENMLLPLLLSQLMGDSMSDEDESDPDDSGDRTAGRDDSGGDDSGGDEAHVPRDQADPPAAPAVPAPGDDTPKPGESATPPAGVVAPVGPANTGPTSVTLPDGRTVTAPTADAAAAVKAALGQPGDTDPRAAYQGTAVKPPVSEAIAAGQGWGAKVDSANLQPGDVGIWKDGRMVLFGSPGMVVDHGALRPLTDAGVGSGFTGFYRPSATAFSDTSVPPAVSSAAIASGMTRDVRFAL
ncbi:MAG: hypothetical protein HOQ24_08560 [Mycobacteriaceae bacterium]|nr:hypothetical protein [Mycobacteriaceae bacterium]